MAKRKIIGIFGIMLVAAVAATFNSCSCDNRCGCGGVVCSCNTSCNQAATFTMYGAPIYSEIEVYSYALRNYSDFDVQIIIDGDTGVIAGSEADHYYDTLFRAPVRKLSATYSPAGCVKVEPSGTAFVRFFNR